MMTVVLRGGAGFIPDLQRASVVALFRRILAVGLVASTLAAIANLSTILVTARIAHHGAAAVAAYGISARLEFLMIPLAFGVGSALTALVGHAVGAGDWATARRLAWIGGLMTWLWQALVGVAVGAGAGEVRRSLHQRPRGAAHRHPGADLHLAGLRGLRPRHGAVLRLDGGGPHGLAGGRRGGADRAGGRRRLAAGRRGRPSASTDSSSRSLPASPPTAR